MARRRIEYTGMEQCECCGQMAHQNDMASAEDGTMYCPTCTALFTVTCACCGAELPLWDTTGNTDDETHYCENCAVSI